MPSQIIEPEPLVTVITVTYNSAFYVRDAMDSVLAQNYKNIEYIILDDCSTDDTWQIIKEYNDPRIKAFRNEINLREYPNRNKAIGLATGKYLFFVDGDDLILHRGIEDTVREFERYPDCDMAIVRTENPKYIGPLRIERTDALNLEFFGGGVLDSSLANNAYRTNFLKQNLFFTEYKNSDSYSRINFLRNTHLLILISPIAIWRLTQNQISKSISIERYYWEYLHFYKYHLFTDKEFKDYVRPDRLKKNYYKTLLSAVLRDLKFFRWRKVKRYREFFMDDFMSIIRFVRQPGERDFWNQFNYENINIEFRRKRL